jgi:hypothetical protein
MNAYQNIYYKRGREKDKGSKKDTPKDLMFYCDKI